ncbi:hypothetical protein LTR95_009989, partial [Oleoguttula sp. CCFEE 5521]
EPFPLPRELFLSQSPFLKAAVSSTWTQDPGKPVDLSDHSAETFNDYINCVYLTRVPMPDFTPPEDASDDDDGPTWMPTEPFVCTRTDFGSLIRIYVLADKLGDLATANIVMDAIVEYASAAMANFDDQDIRSIYEATAGVSNPLRKLCVYQYVLERKIAINPAFAPVQLLSEVYFENLGILNGAGDEERVKEIFETPATTRDRCYFHQHDSEHAECTD